MKNKSMTRRAISVIIATIIILSSFSASFSVFAESTDWTYLQFTNYEPVTIYVNNGSTSLTNGNTYRFGIYYRNDIITVSSSGSISLTVPERKKTQPNYYSSNDGTDELYITSDYFLESDSGSDFVWNNGTLKEVSTGQYLVNDSTSAVKMSTSSVKWTYSDYHFYRTVSSNTRYMRKSGYSVVLGTENTYNKIYAYEKVTVYNKLSDGKTGYYKYDGETNFSVDMGGTFDESIIRDNMRIYYKPTSSTPDSEIQTLNPNSEEISFEWVGNTIDTNTPGEYTAKVMVSGSELNTINVRVDETSVAETAASDPSTSGVENQFSMTSADDGKIATDKTVLYGVDEYGVFPKYDSDEFSIALSALGQSYSIVETEETIEIERAHPDVIFVLDASASMIEHTISGNEDMVRAEATAIALNSAIKSLYDADPETRIGIVTYNDNWNEMGIYLPLDKYTLPEGQEDYIIWGGRNLAKSSSTGTVSGTYQVRTASSSQSATATTLDAIPISSANGINRPDDSDLKLLATSNGVTYYAGYYNKTIYIFRDGYDKRITQFKSTDADLVNTLYVDENIRITRTGTGTDKGVSYRTYSYTNTTGKFNLTKESIDNLMSTNFLINSSGTVVKPSSYHFHYSCGTYTQAGLKAAENMFNQYAGSDLNHRVPTVVLLSDGIPTIGDVNTSNPSLVCRQDVTTGYGYSDGNNVTSEQLSTLGLYTIKTGLSVKSNVNELYSQYWEEGTTFETTFYSIGPGVDYIFGKTVLDPSVENVNLAKNETTGVGDECGNAVGIDLYNAIIEEFGNGLDDFVNYVDWSYTGDMSMDELNYAFTEIVNSITYLSRPIEAIGSASNDFIISQAAMIFTDTIGDGMLVSSDPVVRYGTTNYSPTSSSTREENDSTIVSYSYKYKVKETSTDKNLDLGDSLVTVTTRADGTQIVNWYISADLLPVISYDTENEMYVKPNPIRLLYKVGLTNEAKAEGGTYYTNSTQEPANVEYLPVIGNPYYYDNSEATDGRMHSTIKADVATTTMKVQNITGTSNTSNDLSIDDYGDVTADLGNNGVIEFNPTSLTITKIWDDGGNESNTRPDSITIVIYRNGYVYGDPITISADDCEIGKNADGNDTWIYVVEGLPDSDDFVYTVGEVTIGEYNTSITYSNGSALITNSIPSVQLSYELYLVDKNGNPVTEEGTETTFEDRTVMSDLVTVKQYLTTTKVIDYEKLEDILPEGYYIYNTSATFTETYNGSTNNIVKISDTTNTTKVFNPSTAITGADGTVSGITDYSDIKVAFAIAKIAINPDVIVLDYGKTILCSPLDNDCGNSVQLLGIGDINGNTYSDEFTSENGVFRIEGNNVIFTPFSYMSSINRVKYYVSTASNDEAYKQLNSTIAVIPATSMYYEDDFGGSADNGGLYIQYTGEWYAVDDEGNVTLGLEANTDTGDRQDRGEVGTGKVPYGYDSSYDDCVDFSNGSAAKVTGTVSLDPTTKRPKFDATAQFTFTGTGFDIISRTDLDCGMITVYVTDSTGKSVNIPVINKGTGTLYQIPVISFDCSNYFDNAYGTYTVKINVNAPTTALNITSSVFYLDAIRIYNPMGKSADDNAEFDEANAAYNADHEANEYVASIRDYILQAGKLDETEQYGAVYVDTVNNEYSGGGMLDDEDYETEEATEEETKEETDVSGMETLNYRVLNQSMIKDFELIGPNEEVYLSPGYGVGFILETTKEPASVQLEMKIPAPIQTGASLSVYTFNKTTNIGKLEINSATEMFYDITDDVIFTETDGIYRAVVVLENGLPSTNAGEIVSITNLKLTYDDDVIAVNAADEDALFTLDSVDEENVALTSLKASWNTYENVFDSVYTHRLASTPNYEITDVDTVEKTESGKIVTATVKTSKYVEDLVIKTPKGNVVTPVSITSTLDESKILTDEYKEAKTWTVKFVVYGTDGTTAEYTIESANGDGEVSKVDFEIDNPDIAKIEVYNKPKTSYKVGESFDSTGMTLKVTYVDGTEKIIGTGYATENVKFTKSGKQNVKVRYGGQETSIRVSVTQTFAQVVKAFFAALAKFKFN